MSSLKLSKEKLFENFPWGSKELIWRHCVAAVIAHLYSAFTNFVLTRGVSGFESVRAFGNDPN